MGIQDRDYMRRPPDDDDDDEPGSSSRSSSSDSDAAERVGQFLQRHSRFFRYAGIAIGVLIIIAVIVATVSGNKS